MSFLTGLGGFAGGLASGLSNGEKLQQQIMQRHLMQAQQQGQSALGSAYMGMGDTPTPPANQSPIAAIAPIAGGQSPQQMVQPPQGIGADANAISRIESGGNYGAVGPQSHNGDRPYGKYQVMGANIPQWTQEALGHSMSPQEFLHNPQAQDAVFQHRFGGYIKAGHSPQDAASMWLSGRPLAQAGNVHDVNGTTPAAYVQKFNAALGGGQPQMPQGGQPQMPQGGAPQMPQGQLTLPSLVQMIHKANPHITPLAMFQAVQAAAPMLSGEAKQQFEMAKLQYQAKMAEHRDASMLDRVQMMQTGQNQRTQATQGGLNSRAADKNSLVAQKMQLQAKEFTDKEARLRTMGVARLQQGMERLNAAKTTEQRRAAMQGLEIALRAQRGAVMELIQSTNVNNGGAANPRIQQAQAQAITDLKDANDALAKLKAQKVDFGGAATPLPSTAQMPTAPQGTVAPPTGPIRIPAGMTPQQAAAQYPKGTKVILPDGSPGVIP